MAADIGPRIGIDGEAEFRKELNNLTQQVKTFGAELKAVSTSADDEADAVSKAAKQQEILGNAIDAQKRKLSQLQQALQKATQEWGENDTKTLKWRQSVARAETELNQLESQLKQTTTALDKTGKAAKEMGDDMDNAGKKSSSFGDMLKANLSASAITGFASSITAAISGIISGLGQIVEESKEYQKIMGSLEISSEKAGYTAEETSAAYNELFGVLGDNQTAATTTANLQALGLAQSDLNTLIDGTIGAWATYGDSIPIDGLAEAINETAQTGTVTGTLADMLNWAGTSEDDFNEKLKACSTESERANLILQEMANQGLTQAGTAWQEQNAHLVAANNATALYQQNASALAAAIGPMFTAIQTAGAQLLGVLAQIAGAFDFTAIGAQITSLVEWFTGLVTAVSTGQMTIGEALGQVSGKFTETIGNILSQLGEALPGILQAGVDIVLNLLQGIVDNVPQLLQGVTNLITGAIDALANSLPDFLTKGMEIVASLVNGVIDSLPDMIASAVEAVSAFLQSVTDNLPEIVAKGVEMLLSIVSGIIDSLPDIVSAAGRIVSSLIDTIKSTNWLQVGMDILAGIGQGIINGIGSVVSAARNAASNILNSIKGFFGIHSPSTVMRDMIGGNMMQGWANGIRGGIHNTVGAMQSASRQVYGAIGGQLPAYATASAPGAGGLSGLQIVLNDGTLVGKLSPAINRTLGGYTKMQGRYKVSV